MNSRHLIVWAVLLGAGACEPPTASRPSPPATPPPPGTGTSTTTASPTAEPTASAAPSTPAEPTWSWKGPEPSFGASFYSAPIFVDTKQGPCRFVFEDKAQMRRVECLREGSKKGSFERVWGYDEGGAFMEDASLGADADNLYVALYSNIRSGCEVRAFNLERGDELWRTNLVGVGPIAHSEYLNEVELGLMPGKVQVLGWESAGRYIELVDSTSGRSLSTLRIDMHGKTSLVEGAGPKPQPEPAHPGVASSVRWQWEGPEPGRKKNEDTSIATADKDRCAFVVDDKEHATHLSCEDRARKRLWGIDLAAQFVPAGALAADATRIFFADYSAIATGAVVSAYDRKTGRRLWKTSLFGDGPVSHSKYRNEVELHVVDGRLGVFGWESAGKYVEVLDPATGGDLGNRKE